MGVWGTAFWQGKNVYWSGCANGRPGPKVKRRSGPVGESCPQTDGWADYGEIRSCGFGAHCFFPGPGGDDVPTYGGLGEPLSGEANSACG